MKSEQVLSVEQMKHLQELGLDTSDASMCWARISQRMSGMIDAAYYILCWCIGKGYVKVDKEVKDGRKEIRRSIRLQRRILNSQRE